MRDRLRNLVWSEDVLRAIRCVHPDEIVTDDVLYDEESYYDEIREEVRAAFGAAKGGYHLYDRPPEGRPHWNALLDPDEDAPDSEESAAAYELLFFALYGKQSQYKGELEEQDWPADDDTDEPVLVSRPTDGKVGLAVGISVIAPFAWKSFAGRVFEHEQEEAHREDA